MASRGPTPAVVEGVVERQEGRCALCGNPLRGERGVNWSVHHRRRRDGLPDSHMSQNLVALEGVDNFSGCHGWVHQHRHQAQAAGFWLSRIAAEDPLLAPLLLFGERWVYLLEDGSMKPVPSTWTGE